MAHIILTGATGTAGSAVLAHALASPSISRVSVLSRRPVRLAENQEKANVVVQQDFENYPEEILDQLKGACGCVWAQGISSRGMKEDKYTKITVDYPLAAAKAFATLGENFNFVYVSGDGADMEEKSSAMFGRVKGRAEKMLLGLQQERHGLKIYNLRPALINPQGRYLAERNPSLQDKTATFLGGILEKVWKSYDTPTSALALVCVDLATGSGDPVPTGEGVEAGGRLLRNTAIRRLAGLEP